MKEHLSKHGDKEMWGNDDEDEEMKKMKKMFMMAKVRGFCLMMTMTYQNYHGYLAHT